VHIEHFRWQSEGNWLFKDYSALTDVVSLESIDCKLPLSEIYLKVEFDSEGNQKQSSQETEL
jgi:hypothetical protein